MGNMPPLSPDQDDEDRRADEAEPERRRDAPPRSDDTAERRSDHEGAVHADHVDTADPALQLLRDGPLANALRRGAPDEGVRPEHGEDAERDDRVAGERQGEMGERLDDQPD